MVLRVLVVVQVQVVMMMIVQVRLPVVTAKILRAQATYAWCSKHFADIITLFILHMLGGNEGH